MGLLMSSNFWKYVNSLRYSGYYVYHLNTNKKAISVQAWTGPEGSRSLRLPKFLDDLHMKVPMSALRTGRLYSPRKYSWYSFLLEAESTPGP
jgi:hypothetical protein